MPRFYGWPFGKRIKTQSAFTKKNKFEDFGTHIFQLGNDAQTDILMKFDLV